MSKLLMTTGSVTYSGSKFYITDISVDRTVESKDTTDTGTTGNGKDYTYGRQDTSFSFTMYATASISLPLGTSYECTIDGEVMTIAGSASISSQNYSSKIGDPYTYKVSGKFNGAVVIS